MVVIISRLRQKVMFCLRMLVVVAIFILLWEHVWGLLKGNAQKLPQRFSPREVIYHPASRPYDLGEEKFLDRFLQFWRDYYYGRLGKNEGT